MTKLCPRGKAAAKRKFKVYPSAYANAYASKICAGKIKDPSGVKRKDFRGRKGAMVGGSMNPEIIKKLKEKIMGTGFTKESLKNLKDKIAEIGRDSAKVKKEDLKAKPFKGGPKRRDMTGPRDPRREGRPSRPKDIPPIQPPSPDLRPKKRKKFNPDGSFKKIKDFLSIPPVEKPNLPRTKKAGGGLMEATARLKRQGLKGGGISSRGLGRAFMKGGRV
jgi:hypothetical protein